MLLVFQLYTHREIPDIDDDDDDEEEEASISLQVALIGLLITTLTVTVFSDYLVDSIDEFTQASSMSKTFVGLILLPIVGNAVEHITAVTVAMKDKMDLSMGGKCVYSLFLFRLTLLLCLPNYNVFSPDSRCWLLHPDFFICSTSYGIGWMGNWKTDDS